MIIASGEMYSLHKQHHMTQTELGSAVELYESTANVRGAQYKSEIRIPKKQICSIIMLPPLVLIPFLYP